MTYLALTQRGIKELKRLKRFVVDPNAARKAAEIQHKEAVPVMLMDDNLNVISNAPIGYAIQ